VISGMRIFIPSSCVKEGWPKVGDAVSLYGVVQTFRGEREILIRAPGGYQSSESTRIDAVRIWEPDQP